jgi:hypothetical protein
MAAFNAESSHSKGAIFRHAARRRPAGLILYHPVMRVFVGALIAGVILYFIPGLRSGPACVLAGGLLTIFLLQVGPRSIVEKIAFSVTAGLIAWLAGPRAAYGQSFILYMLGWLLAGTALAFYLHPKSE